LPHLAALVMASAVAGASWPLAFEWWAQTGSYRLFTLIYEYLHLKGPSVILVSDVIFALILALALALPFVRWIRQRVYVAEAIALASFFIALFLHLALRGSDLAFFLRLPALWLFVLFFAVAVGEGAKWLRQRVIRS
jgi:hypothetical protein